MIKVTIDLANTEPETSLRRPRSSRVVFLAAAWVALSLAASLSAQPIQVTTTTIDGTVPGTAIDYTITSTGMAREIFAPGTSDSGTWEWTNGFPEFVGTGAQTLTVDFSGPIPVERIVLGVNSAGNPMTLTVSGGTATTADFDLADELTAVGAAGPLTYDGATGIFTATGANQSLMIGSTSGNTLTSFTLTGDNGGDGYTLFFGTTAPLIEVATITTDGTVPGTSIDFTITSTGMAREIFAPGTSDTDIWEWNDGFPEFVGTAAQTLTVDFSGPISIDRIVLGVNSAGNPMTLTVSGGTATTADFDLADGLADLGGTGPITYDGATGIFTPTGANQSLMIGSTTSDTLTSFTLTGDNGGDGYTLFFGTTVAPPAPEADVSISKTDGVTTAVPGEMVSYTLGATNAGPSADPAVVVSDTFPAELTCSYKSTAAGGATGNTSGSGDITDTLSMPAGSSVTYTANCAIDDAATGTLSNTATISSSVTDPTPGNNSATDDDTQLEPEADLSVVKSDSEDPVAFGASLLYTIDVTNNGPSQATSVVVTDTLPASATFVSAEGVDWTCGEMGGVVVCDLATLSPGSAPLIAIEVTVPQLNTTLTNEVDVSSATVDPNGADNAWLEDTAVVGSPVEVPTVNPGGMVALVLLLVSAAILRLRRR